MIVKSRPAVCSFSSVTGLCSSLAKMPLRSILDIKISAILPDLQIEIITAGREVRWGAF